MTAQRERVLRFFDTEIKNYFLGDLEVLSSIIPEQPHGLKSCAVPQAMMIFAMMDLLAYLLNPSPKAKEDNFRRCFEFT